MANSYFQFKQFTIYQDRCAMKVTTDACIFGGWVAEEIGEEELTIGNCLDIGTGTGLLTLMLTQKANLNIDALEIDKNAAQQAEDNKNTSLWNDRIKIINADARSFQFEKKYDVIISNPPFYEKEIRSGTHNKNIAHHSDMLKLEELLGIIKNNLAANGCFFLLLPYKRNKEIKKMLIDHQLGIEKMVFVRQSVNHDYFRIMLKGRSFQPENNMMETTDISIWNEHQLYTRDCKELLKDYYLYL